MFLLRKGFLVFLLLVDPLGFIRHQLVYAQFFGRLGVADEFPGEKVFPNDSFNATDELLSETSGNPHLVSDKCVETTCKNNCWGISYHCSCDARCIEIGDCCYDFFWYCSHTFLEDNIPNSWNTSIVDSLDILNMTYLAGGATNLSCLRETDLEEFLLHNLIPSSKIFTQIPARKAMYKECMNMGMDVYVWVVTRCLEGTPCSFVNFVLEDRTHQVFVSTDCAKCNNVDPGQLSFLEITYLCDRNHQANADDLLRYEGVEEFLNFVSNSCDSTLIPTSGYFQHYSRHSCRPGPRYINNCPFPREESPVIYDMCQLFKLMVDYSGNLYKNSVCYYCNECNDSYSATTTCLTENTAWDIALSRLAGHLSFSIYVRFSLLLDNDGIYTLQSDGTYVCEVKDLQSFCIGHFCLSNKLSFKQTCFDMNQTALSSISNHREQFLALAFVSHQHEKAILFTKHNLRLLEFTECTEEEMVYGFSFLFNKTNIQCVKATIQESANNIYDVVSPIINTGMDIFYAFSVYSDRNNTSPTCEIGKLHFVSVIKEMNVRESYFVNYDLGYKFEIERSFAEMKYCPMENISQIQMPVCLRTIQYCPKTVLGPSDYKIIVDNGNLTSIETKDDQVLVSDEFLLLQNGSAIICAAEYKHISNPYLEMITLVGNIISITSLVITLTIYSMIPQLRTVPGKLLMTYMAVLLIAQVTLQCNDDFVRYHYFCKVIGFIQHYSWLASFSCMNAMAVKLFMTFSAPAATISTSTENSSGYLIFAIYALVLPLLITVHFLALDLLGTGLFEYGGEGTCWISEKSTIGKLHAFGIPMLVFVLVNIILFLRCFISLFASFRLTSNVNPNRGNFHILLVYLRLSTIMGITWLIGFLPSMTGNPAFWYPFSLLNSLQGFYVLLAFGLSPTARKHMTLKWTTHHLTTSQSTNAT